MLPIDLVLVRHGQSEGNAAKRLSEAGDHSAFTDAFRGRHTASYRLTEKGREQAAKTGAFVLSEFLKNGVGFDRYIVSEYIRAMETAALLDLPNALWFTDSYLTERDWGDLDGCPENEREEKFGAALRRQETEPFFWRPPNGESFLQLSQRVDRVLDTLHRECSEKRVLIVCHGEVMRAFRVRLERMSQERFKEAVFSNKSEDRIHNLEILHYSRKNPESGMDAEYMGWLRRIRPTDDPIWDSGWQKIIRPRYSNEALLEVVSRVPPMVA
ncbi:MAG: histidine phosphatase family protein [Minisyncoccia bacterium]